MQDIILPDAQLDLEYPLMQAIKNRRTKRKWKHESLSMQEVSNILWCACGETKAAYGKVKNKRTIPSACNSQLIGVYAALENGVYKYNAPEHKLEYILSDDIRSNIGTQKMMKSAPFGIIYMADFDKKTGVMKTDYGKKMFLAGTECGNMSQNVYLYCASANLNTALLALTNRDYLKEILNLGDKKEIIYTQVVGKTIEV